jgi:hypothetical protein
VTSTITTSAFGAAVLVATVGNALVYVLLSRRGVPVRFMWAGTPFYLYAMCVRAQPPVRGALRGLALTTNIAFIAALLLAFTLPSSGDSPMSNQRLERP